MYHSVGPNKWIKSHFIDFANCNLPAILKENTSQLIYVTMDLFDNILV